jgi:hypothetical protein
MLFLGKWRAHQAFRGVGVPVDELQPWCSSFVLVCLRAGNLLVDAAGAVAASARANSRSTSMVRGQTLHHDPLLVHTTSSTTLTEADDALRKRGLLINLSFGDSVEVCLPVHGRILFSINLGGYLSGGLSCTWLIIGSISHHELFTNTSDPHDATAPIVPLSSQSLAYLP